MVERRPIETLRYVRSIQSRHVYIYIYYVCILVYALDREQSSRVDQSVYAAAVAAAVVDEFLNCESYHVLEENLV